MRCTKTAKRLNCSIHHDIRLLQLAGLVFMFDNRRVKEEDTADSVRGLVIFWDLAWCQPSYSFVICQSTLSFALARYRGCFCLLDRS